MKVYGGPDFLSIRTSLKFVTFKPSSQIKKKIYIYLSFSLIKFDKLINEYYVHIMVKI